MSTSEFHDAATLHIFYAFWVLVALWLAVFFGCARWMKKRERRAAREAFDQENGNFEEEESHG